MIGLWVNKVNNLNSSAQGLSQEQVDFLHSLEVGDRIVVWNNTKFKEKDSQPDYVIKKGT